MKNFFYRLIIFAFFSTIFFLGCSSSGPEVNSAIVSVVFEYDDFDHLPKKRFSVIIDSQSDTHRAEKLTVSCVENNYIWTSKNLFKFTYNKKNYVGNTNFVMPDYERIPQGKYLISYENSDNQTVEVESTIKYDEIFCNIKAEKCENKIKENLAKMKVVIYDSEDKVLYFGDYKTEFSSKSGMEKLYKTASYYRNVWSTQNDEILCIMPKEYITEEQSSKK